MRMNIEFKGKQAVITARKSRSSRGWVTTSYPCGGQTQFGDMSIYNQYAERRVHEHLNKCLACHVILGLSKAKVLKTQL